MIPATEFIRLVQTAIPQFATTPPNDAQQICIFADRNEPLMIVAGPGSGKTTVLVLRALRFIFVDGLLPEEVLLTTFTRKAAQELRARLIEWGLLLLSAIQQHPPRTDEAFSTWLNRIDINRFETGTLDSICEEVLTIDRDPTDPAPVLVESFVGNALLIQRGLFPAGAYNNQQLDRYLSQFNFDDAAPANFGETAQLCRQIIDRLAFDEVDLQSYREAASHAAARQAVLAAATTYQATMRQTNQMDFAMLEQLFLERLKNRRLDRFTATLRALLVDEYQDTNPLQETIYFELVRQTNASLTVVGDDDQSLYRFRGATVELFRDFRTRFTNLVPGAQRVRLEYLIENYRSTPDIVAFFNDFIEVDPDFHDARVQPLKPRIVTRLPSQGIPVLGMFRADCTTLARDLAQFITDVFAGNGVNIDGTEIIRDPELGNFGDCAFLSHTVNELGAQWGNRPPRQRLPLLLRNELESRGVHVFNPRGRVLRDITVVQQILGTILDCIDPPDAANPHGVQQAALNLRRQARTYFEVWRNESRRFVSTNPVPNVPNTLAQFVQDWQLRHTRALPNWPPEWPLLEVAFKLLSWFPFLRDDPEGQVYLEAIARCIAQAATFSSYGSMIVFGGQHQVNSIRRALRDILAPIAENSVDLDEDIMPSVPRDRVPFLTIHQAKGLEYPFVIVDVASDYSRDHPKNRFRRFPEKPDGVHNLEGELAPYCAVGPARLTRTGLQRAFDDLRRLYYVSFSRAQSALLLVGLDVCLRYVTRIRHVATEWRSDHTWAWITPVSGRRPPPMANHIPLRLI
jgi:ATP-dependent DNA helicase UvrD/PcrA